MNQEAVYHELKKIFADEQILIKEPMKNHTSFRIGGPADFLVLPKNVRQILRLVRLKPALPLFVMGNGSNLLVSDKGLRAIVVKLGSGFDRITVVGDTLVCQSGALLSDIAAVAQDHGLGGFEFASGIPGSLGGAVMMNAGAYDGEMKDVVCATVYIDDGGRLCKTSDHGFGYRRSVFTGTRCVVAQSTIRLFPKDKREIREKMDDLKRRREEKQPLELPSAGSTFKRPQGYFAGKLIDDAGLRGARIGGACVSGKHCGFIVNDNDASFDDVVSLIRHVQEQIRIKFGVSLETEVKICGL